MIFALAVIVLVAIMVSCQGFGEVMQETGEVVLERAPGILGAIIGWLMTSTPVGTIVGAVVGALAGDDVKNRIIVEHQAEEIDQLQEELAQKPTSGWDALSDLFGAIGAYALPIGIAAAGLFIVLGIRAWRRRPTRRGVG